MSSSPTASASTVSDKNHANDDSVQQPFNSIDKTREDSLIRFQMELEFVQLLSNPSYLNYLAQYQYFEDPAFVRFLQYLQYWKQPEYARFIAYPHCLFFLDLLQDEQFRDRLKATRATEFLGRQQGLHWQYYRKNRAIAHHSQQQQQQQDGQDEQTDIEYRAQKEGGANDEMTDSEER